jgi:hypothetical protein
VLASISATSRGRELGQETVQHLTNCTVTPASHLQIGSPSAPVLEFLEEWTTEPLEEVSCSIIPSSTKVRWNPVSVLGAHNGVFLVQGSDFKWHIAWF